MDMRERCKTFGRLAAVLVLLVGAGQFSATAWADADIDFRLFGADPCATFRYEPGPYTPKYRPARPQTSEHVPQFNPPAHGETVATPERPVDESAAPRSEPAEASKSPEPKAPARKMPEPPAVSSGSSEALSADVTKYLEEHTLARLNEYRENEKKGLSSLALNSGLNDFAKSAATLNADKKVLSHLYFQEHPWDPAFCGAYHGENAGFQGGSIDTSPKGLAKMIDQMLASMYAEGPGGGHHDAMINPKFTNVGVGFSIKSEPGRGRAFYMTNDFRADCLRGI